MSLFVYYKAMRTDKFLIFSLVYYPDFVGGAELAIHEITKRIVNQDMVFHMVTLQGNQPEKIDTIHGVTVHRVGWKTKNQIFFKIQKIIFPFLAFYKAKQLHKEHHYTHAWSMMANQAGFAGLFFKLSFPQTRFVLTLQEGDPIPSIKRKVFFVYPLFRMIFKRADIVTAISSYLKKFGESMGAKKVLLLPNGVDLSLFSNEISEESKKILRTKLHITEHQKVLITTSRLVKKNGLEFVIKALANLPHPVVFVVLGIGPLKQELQNLAQKLGVSHRVRFVGFVDYKDIPAYFSIADVFVRPSLSEGLGNSFLEAMYFGLPTVGTKVGGIPDFLQDGETGFLCDPGSVSSLAQALSRALETKETIEPAKNLVEVQYNWNTISDRFVDICES